MTTPTPTSAFTFALIFQISNLITLSLVLCAYWTKRRLFPVNILFNALFSMWGAVIWMIASTFFGYNFDIMPSWFCKLQGAMINYFVLASACWMTIQGYNMYQYIAKGVMAFTLKRLRTRYLMCGFLFPLFPTLSVLFLSDIEPISMYCYIGEPAYMQAVGFYGYLLPLMLVDIYWCVRLGVLIRASKLRFRKIKDSPLFRLIILCFGFAFCSALACIGRAKHILGDQKKETNVGVTEMAAGLMGLWWGLLFLSTPDIRMFYRVWFFRKFPNVYHIIGMDRLKVNSIHPPDVSNKYAAFRQQPKRRSIMNNINGRVSIYSESSFTQELDDDNIIHNSNDEESMNESLHSNNIESNDYALDENNIISRIVNNFQKYDFSVMATSPDMVYELAMNVAAHWGGRTETRRRTDPTDFASVPIQNNRLSFISPTDLVQSSTVDETDGQLDETGVFLILNRQRVCSILEAEARIEAGRYRARTQLPILTKKQSSTYPTLIGKKKGPANTKSATLKVPLNITKPRAQTISSVHPSTNHRKESLPSVIEMPSFENSDHSNNENDESTSNNNGHQSSTNSNTP